MSISSVKTGEVGTSLLVGNAFFDTVAFDSITTTTLGSDSNSVTLSSIPQTYKHLQLRIWSPFNTGGMSSTGWNLRINGSTSTYYSHAIGGYYNKNDTSLNNLSSSYAQDRLTASGWSGTAWPSSTLYPVIAIYDFYDYTNTSKKKALSTYFGFNTINNNNTVVTQGSGLYNLTTAISSISLIVDAGSYATGSIFSLYGIKG